MVGKNELLTVDNTIVCHETEEACEIAEDLQQSIINTQSNLDVSVDDSSNYDNEQDNDSDNEPHDHPLNLALESINY